MVVYRLQKLNLKITTLMGKLDTVTTLKTCMLVRMANFHGLMRVLELVLELASECALGLESELDC